MGLLDGARKAHHAGWSWSVRAAMTRLSRGIQRISPVRNWLDRRWCVTPDSLRDAIEFGDEAPGNYVARFVECGVSRHFLDGAEQIAATVQEAFPGAVRRTLEIADAVCRHEFHFLGRDAPFGDAFDWFWVPGTDRRWPLQHAEDFPGGFYNRDDRPGDIKYPWELNRHQYFVTLGKAYSYTRDEKYAREFTAQVLDWIAKNPFRTGIHWTSEMEFGIRIISWCNAFQFFKDSPYFRERGLEPFLRALYQHARYLRRRLTTGWLAANNHLLGETAGLFVFGVLFPQFRESEEFRRTALPIFADALERQVFSDGVNREQATGYHRFVVDFIWIVVRLGEINNIAIPPVVLQRLEKMLEYEMELIAPDGTAPQIGDCDDGRGLLLSESVPFFDFRGWQAAGAWRFRRPDFWRAAQGGNEETLWLVGADGWRMLHEMTPSPASRTSHRFADGGHCILRTGDDSHATYVFTRCGEFGLGGDGSSVHSHADILSPAIYFRGRALVVDAGTFAYLAGSGERDELRRTASHNTMAPRGAGQAAMIPIWNWAKTPECEIVEWERRDKSTRMTGMCRSRAGYEHRRAIALCVSPDLIAIEDRLDGGSSCEYIDAYLLLAAEFDARIVARNLVHLDAEDGPFAVIEAEGFDGVEITDGWYSPSYGVKIATSRLRFTVRGASAKTRITIRAHVPGE